MLPYGLTKVEYINDSKRVGDRFNGRKPLSGINVRNYLRRYKKIARRANKSIITEHLEAL